MAKDGTNRGGRRVRAGGKAKPLAEKIAEGIPATIMELPISDLEAEELEGAQELAGEDMPNPSEYLSARQKDGRPLGADEIFRETWKWLRDRKCEKFVNPRLLESYSQAFARYPGRGGPLFVRLTWPPPDYRRGSLQPVCTNEPVVSETGECLMVRDLRYSKGKLYYCL